MKEEISIVERDIEVIKKNFADNEYLLKATRALLLGMEVSKADKKLISDVFSDNLLKEAVRRKIYSPSLSNEAPIGQIADFWVGLEQQLFGVSKEIIFQTMSVKEKVFSMLNHAFDLLSNPELDKPNVEVKLNPLDEYQIELIARNLYVKAVDTGLMYIKMIAGKKEESVQDAKKRLMQNSNK